MAGLQFHKGKIMYARIENNQIAEWPIVNIYQRLPQVSFSEPINHANLPDGFVYVGPATVPEYDSATQRLALEAPAMVNGSWQQVYSVVDLSAEQLQSNADSAASAARSTRDAKIAASDWTQVADAPVDQAAWATYRQALRDIPLQSGFPTDIQWPTAPV